jgi:hypothetical protein
MCPPPRAATRRNFLAQAAAVAAGGTVLAVAAVAPARAEPAPKPAPDGSKASPALKAAVQTLDDAHEALKIAKAASNADDAKVEAWQVANPKPTSKRGIKRWNRKLVAYQYEVTEDSWEAMLVAEGQFRKAQYNVAKIQPADVNELLLMAAVAAIYDKVRLTNGEVAIISYQVALSCFAAWSPLVSS